MKKSVLIVDDDHAILNGFKEVLEARSFSVSKAETADAALDKLNQQDHAVAIVDIVLTETNGIDFVKKVSENFTRTVPIILTGYPSFEYAVESFLGGAVEFLVKPCENDDVVEAVLRGVEALEHREHYLQLKQEIGYFPWDRLFEHHPNCVDTLFRFARRKVEKGAFGLVKRCEENFQCLCSPEPCLCGVDRPIREGISFIRKEDKKACMSNNQFSFGSSYCCCCPIRCALYESEQL